METTEVRSEKPKKKKKKKIVYTRQQLVDMLWEIKNEKGRPPTRKDLPDGMFPYFRNEFGKWCYALEESGVKPASEAVLERRRRKKEKLKAKHKAMSLYRSAAGRRERESNEQKKHMD